MDAFGTKVMVIIKINFPILFNLYIPIIFVFKYLGIFPFKFRSKKY